MDALLLVLSVVSLVAGVVLAYVLYQLIRLVLNFFRSGASDSELADYRILRMSDKAIAILCAICFVALVL